MSQRSFSIGLPSLGGTSSITLEGLTGLDGLKARVAEAFAIVDPAGITFHGDHDQPLLSLGDIAWAKSDPIHVRVDDEPVHEPHGPSPLPFFGNRFELYPDILGNCDRLFARYGRVVRTDNMGVVTYYTNDPDVARHVLREGGFFTKRTSDPGHPLHFMANQEALFTCDSDSPAFGPSHKFIPPCMSPKAVRHYTPTLQASVSEVFGVLDRMAGEALAFNVYRYMFKLAGQVIWKIVFGQDLAHFASIDTKPFKTIHHIGEYLALMKRVSLRPAWYGKLPFGDPLRLREARDRVWREVGQAIDASEKGEGDLRLQTAALHATCLADYLLRAVDDDGAKLPREYVVSNAVILFGAGFVTTSSLLSWCIYALCRYPGVQDRLLQELVDHGAAEDRVWTMEELNAMPYLDRFIKETQRMHNPSFQTARNACHDVVLPGGNLLRAGSVIIPIFPSLHRNPRYWDNPARFDPDRWDTDTVKKMPRSAYTPFAAGSRGCIGFSLALLEIKMAMALMVYRYRFVDASREPVVYDPEFLVVRPLNFYASVTKRESWPVSHSAGGGEENLGT